MRDPRYDVLFEPVTIGPVTARNRFYQVPHCSGMGHRFPSAEVEMRRVKAEGGWAVIATQETEIHPSGDISPYHEARLWDDQDHASLRRVSNAVHEHGALAAIELCHNGVHSPNHYSREVPLSASHRPVDSGDPVQARAMNQKDIANLRRWYVNAARRACDLGFDIIYVYAGHDMSILQHFLSRRHNDRCDEYGGPLENRVRLLHEVIEDTKDAIGDRCAIAIRFAVDELRGDSGIETANEGHDVVAMLADLPDLWDVNIADWSNDSQTARFAEEGYQERYIAFVKSVTTKPVVGVGRYTSPDAMVRVIRQGIMDMIGAARPSIADPFLPSKIDQGRIEDIRECIGCNICVSGDNLCVPMRCTQNPTVGEEWRRSWHPETIEPIQQPASLLVIGGGVAGLEAARAAAQRGLRVTVAEATRQLGGRSHHEAQLPGLASWRRVYQWRLSQIEKLGTVEIYRDSELCLDDVWAFGARHVAVATGAHWRCDAVGRSRQSALSPRDPAFCLTPDDCFRARDPRAILAGAHVVVYDDDGYYLGGVLARWVVETGIACTLITPDPLASYWTRHTLEQRRIQTQLMELGVTIETNHTLSRHGDDGVEIENTFTQERRTVACDRVILVTARLPNDQLYQSLLTRQGDWQHHGIATVDAIGDCLAPSTLAAAVYSGHRYARELGESFDPDLPVFRRESIVESAQAPE